MSDLERLRPIIDAAAGDAAKEASRETVRHTFELLGVDIDDVGIMNEFRADLVFARKRRRASERAKSIAFRAGVTAGVTAVVTGFVATVVIILKLVWSVMTAGLPGN